MACPPNGVTVLRTGPGFLRRRLSDLPFTQARMQQDVVLKFKATVDEVLPRHRVNLS